MSGKSIEDIRVAAYYIWEKKGRPQGCEYDCWFEAVKELNKPAVVSVTETVKKTGKPAVTTKKVFVGNKKVVSSVTKTPAVKKVAAPKAAPVKKAAPAKVAPAKKPVVKAPVKPAPVVKPAAKPVAKPAAKPAPKKAKKAPAKGTVNPIPVKAEGARVLTPLYSKKA